MKTLRILGVPEHFNYPFRILEKEQPFLDQGVTLQWKDESRGSGQMNLALRDNETDIALLLTESFLKDFEAGSPSKMIGFHVESPLIWGVHVAAGVPSIQLSDLKHRRFLISRIGSGSHLMARVLAKKEGWNPEELTFQTVSNMDGAKAAMDQGDRGIFLWEKYTTAPMVKNGTMKLISEVPSPWPCFVMVASDNALKEFGDLIFQIRDRVYEISKSLTESAETPASLASFYGLEEAEIEKWLKQTKWCTESTLSRKELEKAIKTMRELGILNSELGLESFLVDGRLSILE
jgi:ABC-type nitrate/sulfonate/bicarbonate transport system substrate-binding protein